MDKLEMEFFRLVARQTMVEAAVVHAVTDKMHPGREEFAAMSPNKRKDLAVLIAASAKILTTTLLADTEMLKEIAAEDFES
ncbi:MAG: hypothetical protein OXP09_21545 [Gammaproteobacteria bacterium]|nr:hypothetical protein [Gammaproteobacteria bacterium]